MRPFAVLAAAVILAWSVPAPAPAQTKTMIIKTPDGVNLAAQEWGNPQGPEILFIHGFSQSHLSWLKQVQSDLGKSFRMITYDARGHGQSDKPLDPAFYKESKRWADEAKAVMDTTGLKKPVLVGWSYAGRIITDYLMTYGDGSLAGVNYVAALTNGELNAGAPAGKAGADMVSDNLATNIASTRAFLRLCFTRQPSQDDFETMVGFNMMTPATVRAHLRGRPTPYEATLKQIKVPVLVTHGEEDKAVLAPVGRYTVATVPGAQGSFYTGIGHAPFWEDAERFNKELSDFVLAANKK